MGAFSSFGRTVAISNVFRPEGAPVLTEVWIALSLYVPVVTDTGVSITEPSASSYARSPYPIGAAYWTLTGPGQVVTTQAITWAAPTDDWGEVAGWAMCTESTSGMVLAYGRLVRSMTISVGTPLKVPAGSIRMSLL